MIYTVTLNPSIDYYVSTGTLTAGGLNRSRAESIRAGGKGINVSLILKELGAGSTALGFIGGFTGGEIEARLEEAGVSCDMVRIPGQCSRINTKVTDDSGLETEINGRGISVTEPYIRKLYDKLDKLADGDILIMSGSVCDGMGYSAYADMISYVSGRGIICIVDTSGEALRLAVRSRPDLVKPNVSELFDLYRDEVTAAKMAGAAGRGLTPAEAVRLANTVTDEDIVMYARRLIKDGAGSVLVSMGAQGAMYITEETVYKRDVDSVAADIPEEIRTVQGAGQPAGEGGASSKEQPPGQAHRAVSGTIGAGDSLLAGFVREYYTGSHDPDTALKRGVYEGTYTVYSGRLRG